MPFMIDNPDLAAQLTQLFPEMKLHYGQNVKLRLGLRLAENSSDQAI